ncbi:MAG: histidine phosphatase family protein, partial [Proteobacteria bacterium]|nr:histidine phosphatase family protein [Pseudomonadota bacterium]
MPEIYLVRHAEATIDGTRYDQLSELGLEQARSLGRYLSRLNPGFDRVVTGSMQRHVQTASVAIETMAIKVETEQHPGLDEYDFIALCSAFASQYPEKAVGLGKAGHVDGIKGFYKVLKQALLVWSEDRLQGPLPESWQEFERRVADALSFLRHGERVLVISSGGPIAVLTGQVLGLTSAMKIQLNMQVRN